MIKETALLKEFGRPREASQAMHWKASGGLQVIKNRVSSLYVMTR
jgi:hypothetical protein